MVATAVVLEGQLTWNVSTNFLIEREKPTRSCSTKWLVKRLVSSYKAKVLNTPATDDSTVDAHDDECWIIGAKLAARITGVS